MMSADDSDIIATGSNWSYFTATENVKPKRTWLWLTVRGHDPPHV